MRYVTLLLCFMLILVLPVAAQDSYPLPDNLQPITINNANQIKHLVSIGGVLPERLSWSPDSKSLLAWTSEGIAIYKRDQLQKPPIRIDPSQQIHFDKAGQVVIGQSAEFDSISRWPARSPSGNIQVKPNYQSDETLVELIHANKVTTTLHLGSTPTVDDLVFSPDEQFLVITSHFSMGDYSTWQLDLWDVASGKRIAFLLPSIDSSPQVAFRGDGKLLVADYDVEPNNERTHVIALWDGRTGENLRANRDMTIPAYFSPDRRSIAIFSKDQIEFWTDHLLGTVENQNYHFEQDGPPFAFSPDSRTFVKTDKLQIQLWDVPNDTLPTSPRSTITASDEIKSLYFSPDGLLLVAYEKQNEVEIWNVQTGAKLPLFTGVAPLSLTAPIFSADGAFLYVYNAADTVKGWEIWDIKQSKQIASMPYSTIFSPDGLWAAYWDGGHVRVLDFRQKQLTDLLVVDNDLGEVLDFNATNGIGFFAGQKFVVGYNLRTGREVLRKLKDESFDALSFNADGSYFVTWATSQKLSQTNFVPTMLWHTKDLQKPVANLETFYGWQHPLLSQDGKLLSILNGSCGDGGGGDPVWNTTTGNNLSKDRYGYCGPYAQSFSPDGKWLVIGSVGQLELVDIEKALSESVDDQSYIRSISNKWIPMEGVGEHHLVFSPDGTTLAIAYETLDDKDNFTNHEVSLYQFSDLLAQEDKQFAKSILTIPNAQTVAFSPDGHWLLTDIGLWNLITGKQQAPIASRIVAFTADSHLMATYDPSTSNLSLWDISTLSNEDNSPIISFEVQPKRRTSTSINCTLARTVKYCI